MHEKYLVFSGKNITKQLDKYIFGGTAGLDEYVTFFPYGCSCYSS
jgi:hypothetical protein